MKIAFKYVCVKTPDGEQLYAFCLAPLQHKDLADGLAKQFAGSVPVSAGFIHLTPEGAALTYGGSESLKLGTRPQDAFIISAMGKAQATCSPLAQPIAS